MFGDLPTNFAVNVAGDKTKPVTVRLTIGPNVLALGVAFLALGGLYLATRNKRR